MILVVHPGSGSRILIFYTSRIQGSKRHRIPDPDPQLWLFKVIHTFSCFSSHHFLTSAAGLLVIRGSLKNVPFALYGTM
jgi:hypothetical protein